MKTLKSIKKIFAIGAIGALALASLTGCTQQITQEDVDAQVAEAKAQAYDEGIAAVDITSDNDLLTGEIARLNQVIEDAKEAEAEIEAENSTEAAVEEVSVEGYDIDDVVLNGTFEATLDNDDLEKLYYTEIEDFEDEDYVAEEKLYLSSAVAPVINMDDMNGEVVVEVADKGAIKYMVEFDAGIVFDSDSDDAFEIDFLGSPMKIVDYDGDATIRLSSAYVLKQDESVTVDGKVITLKGVNEDGDKVYIDVDGESKSIREGQKEKINGIEVYANDLFSGNILNIAELYIGDDVEETIKDGDEYEADDNYEWVITEDSGNLITGIGLIYNEKLVDDDEVLSLADSIVLPNEYLTISFSDIKNMEGMDLTLDLNAEDIDVEYDGKIEVDGDRIEDDSLVLYINNEGDAAYDFEYKGDKYENNTNFTNIKIINDDRILSLAMNDSRISISDADVSYDLDYVMGDEFSSVAGTLTANINDEDDYRVTMGDLLAKSDLNEAGEEEDTFTVTLKDQEEVELVMKVE